MDEQQLPLFVVPEEPAPKFPIILEPMDGQLSFGEWLYTYFKMPYNIETLYTEYRKLFYKEQVNWERCCKNAKE